MMPRYDVYKDSGVEWIGVIPDHWGSKKLKYLAKITLGKMLTPENKGDYLLKPYLRSFNIQSEKVNVSDVKEMWFSEDELENLLLKKNDILINEGGDVGRSCLWNEEIGECYIQNSVNRVKFSEGESNYYLFISLLHHSTKYYDSVVNRVSIPHLTKEKLQEVKFLYPPIPEQTQIVEFLDRKTSLIDKLISVKQRKIELLKEKRTALINHVVTKGLNPNVKMKDSGIEWIGEIPDHWGSKKLKYVSDITLGKMLTPEDKGDYVLKPYLRSFNIQAEYVDVSDIKEMWFSENELVKYRLKKGDLLINEGGDVGRSCQWNEEIEECYIQNSVNRVRIFCGESKYFLLLSILHHSTKFYNSIVNRVSIPHLTKEKLQEVPFLVPPKAEQTQIVEYLDEKTKEIDNLLTLEQKKIDLLKEYRQSLISEVITGKIKVTNILLN
jgi:type I restriction enzyme S subunit